MSEGEINGLSGKLGYGTGRHTMRDVAATLASATLDQLSSGAVEEAVRKAAMTEVSRQAAFAAAEARHGEMTRRADMASHAAVADEVARQTEERFRNVVLAEDAAKHAAAGNAAAALLHVQIPQKLLCFLSGTICRCKCCPAILLTQWFM